MTMSFATDSIFLIRFEGNGGELHHDYARTMRGNRAVSLSLRQSNEGYANDSLSEAGLGYSAYSCSSIVAVAIVEMGHGS